MQISIIKQQLTIARVLDHYNLQPDKNNRLHCPFHNDKTPSLQIYPATNTFCCFSSNCTAGNGDAIQFIQLKENCNKHEALVKAAALVDPWQGSSTLPSSTIPAAPVKLFIESSIDKIAVLTKFFSYYKQGLSKSKKAVEYLESRCIDYRITEIAFNSGGLHADVKHSNLIESMVRVGLLKSLPAKGYSVWAKECIIFPLKNQENKIISLYGRSIISESSSPDTLSLSGSSPSARHFYLSNRSGLYPGYPGLSTKKLILCESIIDAASLLQQKAIKDNYSILSLYGTNGLTEEHQIAIAGLPQLAEIILMLDADEAGEAATAKHAITLQQFLPAIKISSVTLPAGEDVNSVLCTHDDAAVLQNIVEQRKEFFFSSENLSSETIATIATPASQQSKLNTTNAELLIYDNCELYIEILGGIKIAGLDRMKVTLKVKHKEKVNHPQWYSIDLYNQVQREQTINNIAEALDLSTQATTQTFIDLITELESHRLQKIEALH